jgi:hypothetical protein
MAIPPPPAWPAAVVALPVAAAGAAVGLMATLPMALIVMAGAVADVVSGSKTATDDNGNRGYREEQNMAGGKAKKKKRSRRKSFKKTKQMNRKRHGRKSRRRLQ